MAIPQQQVSLEDCQENWEWLSSRLMFGNGDPTGVIKAPIGALYLRLDGDSTHTLYVNTSTSGWVAK